MRAGCPEQPLQLPAGPAVLPIALRHHLLGLQEGPAGQHSGHDSFLLRSALWSIPTARNEAKLLFAKRLGLNRFACIFTACVRIVSDSLTVQSAICPLSTPCLLELQRLTWQRSLFAKTEACDNYPWHCRLRESWFWCTGAVQTLMSVDADRVVNLCASLHELWSLPAQIAIALYLLYTQVRLALLPAQGRASRQAVLARLLRHRGLFGVAATITD